MKYAYSEVPETLNDMEFFPADDLKTEEIFLRLDRTCEAQPDKNWVPAYYFSICLPDGTKIGQCDLRIGHNDRLYIGGNIGYEIEEAYRGHRYAAKACKLLFRQAKKHQLNYVIITCDPTNKASSRTCELAGGQYVETATVPEWHDMYEEGKRQAMVYRFFLKEHSEKEAGMMLTMNKSAYSRFPDLCEKSQKMKCCSL